MNRILLLVLLGVSLSASAQTHAYAGVVAGAGQGVTNPGVAGDLSAIVQHRRVLVDLHVVGLDVSRFQTFRIVDGRAINETPLRTSYSAALDVNYVLPVYRAVSIAGGAGLRLRFDPVIAYGLDKPYSESPYVNLGALVGRPGSVRLYGRVEPSMVGAVHLEWVSLRTQVGVLVPLHR